MPLINNPIFKTIFKHYGVAIIASVYQVIGVYVRGYKIMEKSEFTQEMSSVLETIKLGNIYAHIESVSQSGMSRRILFYRINHTDGVTPFIENVTHVIGWLSGNLPVGEYKQGSKYVSDKGLLVSGCGMDMIFHTLYHCMPYEDAKDWNQHYKQL